MCVNVDPPELRMVCLPLVMDIMECEQRASCNFKRVRHTHTHTHTHRHTHTLLLLQVETEVFDKMDELVTSGRGDEEYRELFQDMSVAMPTTRVL